MNAVTFQLELACGQEMVKGNMKKAKTVSSSHLLDPFQGLVKICFYLLKLLNKHP